MPPLDPDHCYGAVQRRDERFDGWFVTAVKTTGIYCRPSCPAITPKRANVDFFPTAAAAQQVGFRACKRCRPDASPGSPEWSVRQDVVGRAMRLIADGVVERDGVGGVARRLGYSERQLNRVVTQELGAGPLAIARAQRAQTARLLVETTSMPLTDIAFAAGFGSIRQFNDTFREVFAASPTELRGGVRGRRAGAGRPETDAHHDGPAAVTVRLPVRKPFAADAVMRFVGERAIPGLERWDGVTYTRALDLPRGDGVVDVVALDDHVSATITLTSWSDLGAAIQRVRRLFDLDADPTAIDDALAQHPALRPLIALVPGRRAPASVDPFETAVRAVVGQQVSVAGARTVAARIVAASDNPVPGTALSLAARGLRRFPRAEELAVAPDAAFSMPTARRDTIRRLAAAVADGTVELHFGVDPSVAREQLLALRGIGPWTAEYVVMRGLGHPDTFLTKDLGVIHALDRLGLDADSIANASPWRSYVVHHLWASLAPPTPPRGAPMTTTSTSATSTSAPNAPTPLFSTVVDSPVGPLTIVASDRGVRAVLWPDDEGRVRVEGATVSADHPVLAAAAGQLEEYFAGARHDFDVPLDPVGTEFQRSAWQALRTIGYGETISYGEQASRMGDRRKARAVGAANGRNPISIIVPCHRVVGADGSLTGFAGGTDTKAWLLDHERLVLAGHDSA